jgi:ferredoxin--NADP+ reductase
LLVDQHCQRQAGNLIEKIMTSVYKIAIIGSGPSGFYAAEALLDSEINVEVHMYERLPTPFGLVRSGVAPDHPKLKQVINIFKRIAEHESFKFFGNVSIGEDVSLEALQNTYSAVVFATGAGIDRSLNIPGEALKGSHSATEFVGWYNGHPDFQDCTFDLSNKSCVVIGHGNVSADVCRILLKSVDELKQTDITQQAIDTLSKSNIQEVHIIGRRGPAQSKFSTKELRELSELENCEIIVNPEDLVLNDESAAELDDRANLNNRLNVELLRTLSEKKATGETKKCYLHFLKSPTAVIGEQQVDGIELTGNDLSGEPFYQKARSNDHSEILDCGTVFRSVGYRGSPIQGVPFDDQRGVIPNVDGRVTTVEGEPQKGIYVTGWIKRGPSGIIGTNRADSVETVETLLSNLSELTVQTDSSVDDLLNSIRAKGVQIVTYEDWLKIDNSEVEKGSLVGKPREKMTKVKEMLQAVKS